MINNNSFMNESLAKFVNRKMIENRLSGEEVSKASGRRISQSTVNRIQNGEVLTPSVPKLKALAKGLDIPEHELFAAARGLDPKASLSHERLAAIEAIYNDLPKPSKQKADSFIEMLEREIIYIASKNKYGGMEMSTSSARSTKMPVDSATNITQHKPKKGST